MWGERQTDVLVVGAGPVGMLTALLLEEAGLQVTLIDEEWRSGVHSYACALHPHTIELMDRLGLSAEVLKQGYRIEAAKLYEGPSQRAEIKLAGASGDYPFLVVMEQSALEELFEERLNQKNIKVLWNHRLSDLQAEGDGVVATIDKLGGTALGYSVPTWEIVVQKRYTLRAPFIIGADGHRSMVRRLLDIEWERLDPTEIYGIYEFETDGQLGREFNIVLNDNATSVMWPLPGGRCRWSFQRQTVEAPLELPAKERRPVRFSEEKSEQANRQQLLKLLQERAPWFKSSVGELHWSIEVPFGHRLAKQFGKDHCWLVGDAAHQTGPVGAQSMNVGLQEAAQLVELIKKILREKGGLDLLETYNQDRRNEWQQLLGLKGGLKLADSATPWVKKHYAQMLPCLPASGKALGHLLKQLGLSLAE